MAAPLYFTLLRVFLVPLFPLFYLFYERLGISLSLVPYILILILLLCEFTDLFDGFIARKLNKVTDLGKILDPTADSVTRLTVLFTFSQGVIQLPLLLVLVFLFREFMISTLRTICALKGFALAARKSGKLKAVILASISFLILLLMIPYTMGYLSLESLRLISLISVSLAAVYTVFTAVDYFYANRSYIKKAIY
ncbi:MAG TPA: CDP-alcohol phosphatidyltransferase family protein [Chlamydiales bacterium]|nr:CDP-alcohol phosphatidyltransferase family protein [Chlamydiales bacterium]